MIFARRLLLAFTLISISNLPAQSPAPTTPPASAESKEQREARMAWWHEAKFGMFIHWGVYSVPAGYWQGKPVAGIGEWIMNRGKIPMADYQAFAKDFNPVKFNAEEWVKIAKNAGMKYMVITSKHHDGFAMFDSKASNWNIVKASPYGKDPLKDLAAACRKEGIKLGFYYSQAQDWNNGGSAAGGKWDKAQEHDMDDYIDKIAVPQVREIMTNYGEFPAVVWWDTPTGMNAERANKIAAVVKELRPNIIMNNRLGGGVPGDTETPEQFIPAQGFPGKDWETCMTMNNTWGFKKDDEAWKPTEKLIRNLCDIASKGGNYLLNVGPTSEGLIPQPSIDRLKEVGEWMKVNGEAVYGTQSGPFTRAPKWGRASRKGDKTYLFVFDWPKDGKLNVPLIGTVSSASLLAKPGEALKVESKADGLVVSVPAAAPDAIASVIVLQSTGELKPAPVPPVTAQSDGTIRLNAVDASIVGNKLRLSQDANPHLENWTVQKEHPQWDVEMTKGGKFTVTLDYACDPKDAGSDYQVAIGIREVKAKVEATKSGRDYQSFSPGTIEIKDAGNFSLTVEIINKAGQGGAMNLRSVTLKPVQ